MSDEHHELQEFGERRADIGAALSRLEDALARPIGSPIEWRSRVGSALDDLATVGRIQIAALLAPEGPLEEAIRTTPRLSGPVERLRRDLPGIEVEAGKLQKKLDELEPSEIRRLLIPFLGRVVHLRQAVADALWETYSVDIGGAG